MRTIKGWVQITERTAVRFENGKPVRISTTARDFDAATDAAAQYVGEALDVGEWRQDDGSCPRDDAFRARTDERDVPWCASCSLSSEAIAASEAKDSR